MLKNNNKKVIKHHPDCRVGVVRLNISKNGNVNLLYMDVKTSERDVFMQEYRKS